MKKYIIVIVLLIGVLLSGCSSPDDDSYGDIEARVTHTGSAIRVENQNSWSWTDVELELNGSYTYHLSRLGAGTSRTIQLSSFSDDEGFRFSSYQKAKSFWIMCEDPSGDRKYYSGSWN